MFLLNHIAVYYVFATVPCVCAVQSTLRPECACATAVMATVSSLKFGEPGGRQHLAVNGVLIRPQSFWRDTNLSNLL